MKNKTATTVNTALIEILDHTEPTMINCDKGSEFINSDFKKILTFAILFDLYEIF